MSYYDQIHNKSVLEALIFASAEPVKPQLMLEMLPEGTDLKPLLQELQADYADRGIRLVERDGAYAFRTAPELAEDLKLEKQNTRQLSRAALETLAIIAYHQPVTRSDIEQIRGVSTGKGTLDTLMECGFIKPGKRREVPGRPSTWVTTPYFIDHFGLENLNDLPGLQELKSAGMLDSRPAIDTLPETEDMFEQEEEA